MRRLVAIAFSLSLLWCWPVGRMAETRNRTADSPVPVNLEPRTANPPTAEARVPRIYWTGGPKTMDAVKKAGLVELAVPVAELDAWKRSGFKATGIDPAELKGRRPLAIPKLAGRGNVASATRRPWIDANGWLFTHHPNGHFIYNELPAGKAELAAAEAYAYGTDTLISLTVPNRSNPAALAAGVADLKGATKMLEILRRLPMRAHSPIADFTVVDNKSPLIDEVLNLLTRRNLLYRIVPTPVKDYAINIRLGSTEYPDSDAADPSAFAQLIRRRIGDENRSLRIYGSEVIIGHLTGDRDRARLHLLNYSGREAHGLRIRLRGNYRSGKLHSFGLDRGAMADSSKLSKLEDEMVEGGVYEFTIADVGYYTIVDLGTDSP